LTHWTYPRCVVVAVHDGDTISVDIDLGQDMWVKRRSVRLSGIAARELREPGGKEARDALTGLALGANVLIDSIGWDKYGGRIDGLVYLADGSLVQAGADPTRLRHPVGWQGCPTQAPVADPLSDHLEKEQCHGEGQRPGLHHRERR
jgi:hypothetical protein